MVQKLSLAIIWVIGNPCRPLEIGVSVSERPGLLFCVKSCSSACLWQNMVHFHPQHWNHSTEISATNFSSKKRAFDLLWAQFKNNISLITTRIFNGSNPAASLALAYAHEPSVRARLLVDSYVIHTQFESNNTFTKQFVDNSCICRYTSVLHDDVIKWKHFPRYWPFVWGIHRPFVWGIHRSRWIPRTKASDAGLWCFLWSAPE